MDLHKSASNSLPSGYHRELEPWRLKERGTIKFCSGCSKCRCGGGGEEMVIFPNEGLFLPPGPSYIAQILNEHLKVKFCFNQIRTMPFALICIIMEYKMLEMEVDRASLVLLLGFFYGLQHQSICSCIVGVCLVVKLRSGGFFPQMAQRGV